MRVAIVGFPKSGKTTLFSALTALPPDRHPHANEEVLAAVKIPEPRLDWLEQLYGARKRTEATLEFVDLPAALDSESEKAGLAEHLPTLRQVDMLCVVLRGFESASVQPHRGRVDPEADLAEMRDEMLIADLLSCANRIEKLEKAIHKPTKDQEHQKRELLVLQRCREALENGRPLRAVVQPGEEEKLLRSFGLLTMKPTIVIINVSEADIGKPPVFSDKHSPATFAVCAPLEADLIQMDPADRPEFMKAWNIPALARDRIIRACFDALGMICFLTAGPEEVRAWPVARGTTAVEAAGKIHTDLARGFIKAETIAYDELRAAGSMRDAKAHNKLRLEPKHYVVQDGDVILFKHSG